MSDFLFSKYFLYLYRLRYEKFVVSRCIRATKKTHKSLENETEKKWALVSCYECFNNSKTHFFCSSINGWWLLLFWTYWNQVKEVSESGLFQKLRHEMRKSTRTKCLSNKFYVRLIIKIQQIGPQTSFF